MKQVSLGKVEVSRVGLGAMGMSAYYTGAGSDDAESIRTIQRALDLCRAPESRRAGARAAAAAIKLPAGQVARLSAIRPDRYADMSRIGR